MPGSFLAGITPFIQNMDKHQKGQEDKGPQGKMEITKNGQYNVSEIKDLTVDVPAPEGSITPEEQYQIVNDEEF